MTKSLAPVILALIILLCENSIYAKPKTRPEKLLDSIQVLLNADKEDTNMVWHLYKKGYILSFNDNKKAGEVAIQVLNTSLKLQFTKGFALGAFLESMSYFSAGNYNEAIRYCRKSDSICKKINFLQFEDVVLGQLGWLYFITSDYDHALAFTNQSIVIAKMNSNTEQLANNYNTLGYLCSYQQKFSEALGYYQKDILLYNQLNDLIGEADAYGSMAIIYHSIGEDEKAIGYGIKSFTIIKKTGDSSKVYSVAYNLAEYYSHFNDSLDKAINLNKLALNISEKIGNVSGVLNCLSQASGLYLNIKDFPKALKMAQLALATSTKNKIRNETAVADAYSAIGQVNLRNRNYVKSLAYIDSSLAVSVPIHYTLNAYQNLKLKSEVYEKMNQPAKALEVYKNYIIARDSFFNEEKKDELTRKEMQFGFDTAQAAQKATQDKKDILAKAELSNSKFQRNIGIAGGLLFGLFTLVLLFVLRKVNRLNNAISKEKERSDQLGKAKDKLFSIISHDLRSPLNNMDTVLALLNEGELSEAKMRHYGTELSHMLHQNMGLLDNMLYWANTQMDGLKINKKPISVNDIIEETIWEIKRSAEKKKIMITEKTVPGLIAIADMSTVRLVLRNILGNAIKFTPSGGTISIEANQYPDDIKIDIIDNGLGMSQEIINTIQSGEIVESRIGTDLEKGFGIGLKLCKEFIERNGGKMSLESTEGKGTCVSFTIPLPDMELVNA